MEPNEEKNSHALEKKFPNLQNGSDAYIIFPIHKKGHAYSNESVLMCEYEFSHGG